jgi:Flp pilus assembly protein TadG
MLNKFLKQRRAVAALEFVLVAPLLVILLFGVYDLSSALITYEEVYAAAHSMAASISNAAVQADGTNSLTYTEVQQGASLLWAESPTLRSGFQDGVKSVTISSIVFVNTSATCTPTVNTVSKGITTLGTQCTYLPVVVWSVAYMGGDSARTFDTPTTGDNAFSKGTWTTLTGSPSAGETLRSCNGTAKLPAASTIVGSLSQSLANAGSSSDMTNLRTQSLTTPAPSNPAPPSPILVVDVQLNYQPVIGLFLNKGLDLWVNAYWPVRSVKTTLKTTYPLYEEFTTLTPDVPTGVTATTLANSAANNIETRAYDASGTVVPTNNYCVNTSLYNATSFPYAAETQ